MIKCPICVTNAQKYNQEYCFICAWEFEYYIDELSQAEKDKYFKKMEIAKSVYVQSKNVNNPKRETSTDKRTDFQNTTKQEKLEKSDFETSQSYNQRVQNKKFNVGHIRMVSFDADGCNLKNTNLKITINLF